MTSLFRVIVTISLFLKRQMKPAKQTNKNILFLSNYKLLKELEATDIGIKLTVVFDSTNCLIRLSLF